LPRDVVMDRDSAFHMSHSRVLRVVSHFRHAAPAQGHF
jgi:hypothetical protein